MLRVALYARYSSDLQNPQSIDDQFRLCRQLAERQDGRSLATIATRPFPVRVFAVGWG